MVRLLATVLLLGCLSTESKAAFTGMDLLEECTGSVPQMKASCEAWIAGFDAALFGANEMRKLRNISVCIPEGFTGKQAVLVVTKYIKEHPELLHNNAGPIAFLALWFSFPCSEAPH